MYIRVGMHVQVEHIVCVPHKHTHTRIYMYIYVYIYICTMCLICVCVGACMFTHVDARVRVTQNRLNKVSNPKRQNTSPLTEVCIPLNPRAKQEKPN